MKKILTTVLFAAGGLICPAADAGGELIFSDDFSTPALFTERWEIVRAPKDIVCVDGKLRMPRGEVRWKGEMPEEFEVVMEYALFPGWSKVPANLGGPKWAGFSGDYGGFNVRASGGAAVLYRLPGMRNTGGSYKDCESFVIGKNVTVRYIRKKRASSALYKFYINGELMHEYSGPMPEKTAREDGTVGYKPLTVGVLNCSCEIDSIKVYRISSESDSPNTVFNSSFEHDEDEVPTHYNIIGTFDWYRRDAQSYENVYLKSLRVDRKEKRSGRQSLRINYRTGVSTLQVRPSPCLTMAGACGVFSVWLKASREGLPVRISYGGARAEIVPATSWTRYEVASTNLPPPGYQSPASMAIVNPEQKEGVIWTDDWQIEFFDRSRLADGAPYATPYRLNDSDRERFAAKTPNRPSPGHSAPLTPSQAALRGYQLKKGESLVLGRLDYYMNEKEARFRIWNEEGEMQEVSHDIADLPCGTNSVTLNAHGRQWKAKVVKLPPRENATQINNFSRSIVHNGRGEVFSGLCSPIGRFVFARPKDATSWPMLDFLVSKGFRHVHLAVWADRVQVENAKVILEYARKCGLLVDLWTGDMSKARNISEDEAWACLEHPNVCAYQVMDEPEIKIKSEDALKFMRAAHARLPYGAVFFNSAGTLGVSKNFANLEVDILMLDNYLTNNHAGRTVDSVVGCTDLMLRARPGKPSWYFVVSDNMTLHYKNPSYGEQVAQSWGNICAGGTGVSWYIGFPNTEPTWRAMIDVNRELQELAPVILSEELCGAAAADADTRYLRHQTRKLDGDWYIYSCNIDASPLKKVVFTMPADAPQNGVVEVLYENRTLKLKNGVFRDSYNPHSRHIYRIKKEK